MDRLQKSSAHKTARESQRTRNLLQEEKLVEFTQTRTQRLLDDYKKCLQAVIAVKCSADFFLLRALFCLFFYYYFETVKDVNLKKKKGVLLKILKQCVIFNILPFGNQVICYSLTYSDFSIWGTVVYSACILKKVTYKYYKYSTS